MSGQKQPSTLPALKPSLLVLYKHDMYSSRFMATHLVRVRDLVQKRRVPEGVLGVVVVADKTLPAHVGQTRQSRSSSRDSFQ